MYVTEGSKIFFYNQYSLYVGDHGVKVIIVGGLMYLSSNSI